MNTHCQRRKATEPVGSRLGRAFTLIELMVVIGIVALVMTISIPSIYRKLHPDSISKAVDDVLEACRYARGRAVLEGTPTDLVFRPGDRTIDVVPSTGGARGSGDEIGEPGLFSPSVSGNSWRMDDRRGGGRTFSPSVSGKDWRMSRRGAGEGGGGGSIFSAKMSDRIIIEGLGINGLDYTEDAVSRVRFFPNGTSDEMSLILLSDKNERRNITLEVVTALPDVEVDPAKFKSR